jgi:hypothetical protein
MVSQPDSGSFMRVIEMKDYRIILLSILLLGLSGCGEQGDGSGGGGQGDGSGGGGIGGGGVTPDPSQQPSVGIPDQNSSTLVATVLNTPSWGEAGIESTVTMFLADQLNNSSTIPDGTIVYFAAEGGAIDDFCMTTNGTCSVTWRSQLPVPAQIAPERAQAGRVSILAWSLGVESFNDNNSNGLFDAGDTIVAGTDVGDPFIDKNENGIRELDEEFVNYPNPGLVAGGAFVGPDGLYSGPNCAHPTLCASNSSVFIYKNLVLTMSSNLLLVTPVEFVGGEYNPVVLPAPVTLGAELSFLIIDQNGNPPPLGATISFNSEVGILRGSGSFVVNNTSTDVGLTSPWLSSAGEFVYTVRIDETPDNDEAEVGVLTVTAQAGEGNPSEIFIDLFDPANP